MAKPWLSGTAQTDSFTLGRYRTLRILDRGGMGSVYEAEDAASGRRVALKVMNGALTSEPVARERFLREARAIEKLSHPHIVELLDAGVDAGRPFIVMELLVGETLHALLASEGRLPLSRLVQVFTAIVSAVSAIHAVGIVHRDLKLANVFMARCGFDQPEPVILDFGISRVSDAAADDTSLTRSAGILGTLRYLSPEQVRNAKCASALSDQYAIGVMLYECATGKAPFSGASSYDVMHAILTHSLPPPSALVPELPRAFDSLVLRALEREPGARFPDVRALGEALSALTLTSESHGFASEVGPPSGVPAREATEPDPRPPGPDPVARRGARSRAWISVPMLGLLGTVGVAASLTRQARAPSAAKAARTQAVLDEGQRVSHVALPSVTLPTATFSAIPQLAPSASSAPARLPRAPKQRAAPISMPRATQRTAEPLPSRLGKDDVIDPFAEVSQDGSTR